MRASRFVPSRPPVLPYTGPLEPDEPSEPREPMPLKGKTSILFRPDTGDLEWEIMIFQ